ncbi:MAG: purine-nucleoside phosphorylase [Desulfatiglandaceae bacterium]
MEKAIKEAAGYIEKRIGRKTEICMITGTGLGSLTGCMDIQDRIPYEEIPHFPHSTTQSHRGTLAVGTVKGRHVCALEGRFHLYEGYTPAQVAFSVRVMKLLGAKRLFISSAAGGLNPLFAPADLMLVTDHINMTAHNPLIGANLDLLGPRFPDMAKAYDPELVELASNTALDIKIPLQKGVYAGVSGPSMETSAETRFLRMTGADAVGMSTVHETIAGVHCGLRVLAIVAITNVNLPDCMEPASLDTVIANARKASPSLSKLWEEIIARLPDAP